MNNYFVFSEAIRDGAKLRPQTFEPRSELGSCAIEAGSEMLTGEPSSADYTLIEQVFPYMTAPMVCPEGCLDRWAWPLWETVINACWHLNDHHKWTRERIADWLDAEEEKLGFITIPFKQQMIAKPSSVESLDVVGSELS